MGKRYLVDTNILIAFLERSLPATGQDFVATVIDTEFIISIINRIEILGYDDVSEETRNFIQLASVIELDKSVAEATINIRKSRKVKLPDAIIAATAIANDLTLITRNKKDFQQIPNVEIVDPFSVTAENVARLLGD